MKCVTMILSPHNFCNMPTNFLAFTDRSMLNDQEVKVVTFGTLSSPDLVTSDVKVTSPDEDKEEYSPDELPSSYAMGFESREEVQTETRSPGDLHPQSPMSRESDSGSVQEETRKSRERVKYVSLLYGTENSVFHQGSHSTGIMVKCNSRQGKHREFENFGKTQVKHTEFEN